MQIFSMLMHFNIKYQKIIIVNIIIDLINKIFKLLGRFQAQGVE